MHRFLFPALALVLILSACSSEPAGDAPAEAPATTAEVARGEVELTTEHEKILYTLGIGTSHGLTPLNLTAEELAFVQAGIEDGVLGREPRVNLPEYAPKVRAYTQEKMAAGASVETAASAEFLERMAAEPGAVRTESGLVYVEMVPGTGPSPTIDDTVRLRYHGTLRDGTVFDSTMNAAAPVPMILKRVIPCWGQALQRMKAGGRSRFFCPPELAYGLRGFPPRIPPGAALAFEVELVSVVGP